MDENSTYKQEYETNLGLMNFIQSLLASTKPDVRIEFDLNDTQAPYTDGNNIHLPKSAAYVVGAEQKRLRAYLTHQIAHTKYTDFSPVTNELADKEALRNIWEELIAVRADVLTVKEGYFGDTEALAYQEQFYNVEAKKIASKLGTSSSAASTTKRLSTSSDSSVDKAEFIQLALYLLTYSVRKQALPNIKDAEIEAALGKLKSSKDYRLLGPRILKYASRLEDIAQIESPKHANIAAIELAKDIIQDIENDGKDNNEKSDAGLEAQGNNNNSESNVNKDATADDEDIDEDASDGKSKTDEEIPTSGRFSTSSNDEDGALNEATSFCPPNKGNRVGISKDHEDLLVSLSPSGNMASVKCLQSNASKKPWSIAKRDFKVPSDLDYKAKLLSRHLIKKFRVLDRARIQGNKKKGKINARALHKILPHTLARLPDQPRVYKQKENSIIKKSCVTLLIDFSGSMYGNEIKMAIKSAYILASALQSLNIPYFIEGFSTASSMSRNFIFSTPDTPKSELPKVYSLMRKIAANGNAMACNTDADSVYYAATRLLQRKEPKKVMIVLSDGMPAGHSSLFNDVKSLQLVTNWLEGLIHLHGIGIYTDAPKKFYTSNAKIKNLDELPKVVLDKLSDSILPTVAQ